MATGGSSDVFDGNYRGALAFNQIWGSATLLGGILSAAWRAT